MTETDFWLGNRVRLRMMTLEDVEELVADSRDGVAQRLGDQIRNPAHPDTMKKRIEKSWSPKGDKVGLAIESVEGKLVGSIGVHELDQRHRHFTYGVSIFRGARRNGYASEGIALLLRYYFRELGYHRAQAFVYGFNEPSIELHRHLGFVEEGRVRQTLYTGGKFYDELVFGMLSDEFGQLEQALPKVPMSD